MIYFAKFLGPNNDLYSINKKEHILAFLDTKIKDSVIDPDKRWIRTWNDYLQRIKYFIRWLWNCKEKENKGLEILPNSDWITPVFAQIKEKRTKRFYLLLLLISGGQLLVILSITYYYHIMILSGVLFFKLQAIIIARKKVG